MWLHIPVLPPAGLPAAQQETPPAGLTAGSLPASVVEVQTAGSLDSSTGGLLLVSSGRGDVSLAVRPAPGHAEPPAAAGVLLSVPAWPLRPPPPLQGVRPLHLAAAFVLPQQLASAAAGGQIISGSNDGGGQQQQAPRSLELCCILWAGRPRSEQQPSRCEVYAVRLAAALGGAEPSLQVAAVQLLKVRRGLLRPLQGMQSCSAQLPCSAPFFPAVPAVVLATTQAPARRGMQQVPVTPRAPPRCSARS